MRPNFLIFALLLATFAPLTVATQETISLEGIWKQGLFSAQRVPGFNFMNDGRHYSRLENNRIVQYDLTTGTQTGALFDGNGLSNNNDFNGQISSYSFSEDESKLLIQSERESIYRRSFKAQYFVYDRASQSLEPLFPDGKVQYATFNPQGNKVAFVYLNDLYFKDLKTNTLTRVTTDGEQNAIINGAADWVYEEEFSMSKAFEWSPDGERLAWLRFDEREVPEFTMTNYKQGLYPEYVTFKYPKVGENNARVTAHIFQLNQGQRMEVAKSKLEDYYLPRLQWTTEADELVVTELNRHQNQMTLFLVNANDGSSRKLFEERSNYYIELESTYDYLTFLENGRQFIIASDRDGYNHLYLFNKDGSLDQQLTKGKWEVTNFYGLDERNGKLYFQAAKNSPLEREVYKVDLSGKKLQAVAEEAGDNTAQFSSNFLYYTLTHSDANTPPVYTVYDRRGREIRTIEDNAPLVKELKKYAVQPVEFFDFKTERGDRLNGWIIKPTNFDERRRYPVLMYVYGGPGSQTVNNRWSVSNFAWFQMLAQQGYVVASVDNRGTGARGRDFQKQTYLELGKMETEDQISAAKYLGELPFTDPGRIGIFGWSYGGYMSSLGIFKGNEVFKAAIAVAPVTNWKWYDSIYTERYMRTLVENEDGYEQNSPVNFADRLKGAYLLVHGMGDDNVHFQHTAEMVNALVDANKPFDTYFYPNRNHGIYGGNTRLHLYQKMTDFLEKRLKDRPATSDNRRAGDDVIRGAVPSRGSKKQ